MRTALFYILLGEHGQILETFDPDHSLELDYTSHDDYSR